MTLAVRMANQQMRVQILPQLSYTNKHVERSWNPLMSDSANLTELSMRLRMPDDLVIQLLQNGSLMSQVDEIIDDAIFDALNRNVEIENTSFVAAVLRDLVSEDSEWQTESEQPI